MYGSNTETGWAKLLKTNSRKAVRRIVMPIISAKNISLIGGL